MTATDISKKAVQYSQKHFDGDIYLANLEDILPFKNDRFDVILSLDVLEHINNDKIALDNLANLLKKDGRIIITAPAHMFLWSYHDRNHMHKRRYTTKKLKSLVKSCNCKCEYITYYNMFLFPAIVLTRLIKNIFKKNIKNISDGKMPNSILNNLLFNLFSCEKLLIDKRIPLPFGVSILAIIRKN